MSDISKVQMPSGTIYGLKDTEARKRVPETLLKSTVGWTGKNLLNDDIHFYESGMSVNKSGHTFTIETTTVATQYASLMFRPSNNTMYPAGQYNLSLDVSTIGDATARVAIRRSNNSIISAKILSVGANLLEIDTSEDFYISVFPRFEKTNAVTLVFSNPMLRDASITDDTYEPYHESVETMYEEEIHGVNLIKNVGPSKTINGVTFTVNADGSVIANGTATAQCWFSVKDYLLNPLHLDAGSYFVNGCSGGSSSTYSIRLTNGASALATSYGGETAFNLSSSSDSIGVYIVIDSNQTVSNLVFKPMIRKAEIEDSTYRPYNEQAIQNQLNNQTGVLGAKNLLENTATSRTVNGVTFTVNDDGSVTVNGTATAEATFNFMSARKELVQGETYIISGCPSDAAFNTYDMARNLAETASGTNVEGMSSTGDVTFSVSNKKWFLAYIRVRSGITVSNLTFKPMLRLASDPDDTYVPYAMTNRELTEKKIDAELTFVTGVSVDTLTENKRYYCSGGMTGLPTGNIGYLDVHRSPAGEGIHQTFYPAGTQGEIYVRRYWDNAWGSWYKFTGTVVS